MLFRQTAALGLSALILGSNLVLPYSMATTMAMSSQPDAARQFANLTRNPLFVAMAEQAKAERTSEVQERPPVHPIHRKRVREAHRISQLLHPWALILRRNVQEQARIITQNAATVPVKAVRVSLREHAQPIQPAVAMNPAISEVLEPTVETGGSKLSPDTSSAAQPEAQSLKAETAPATQTDNQVLTPGTAATKETYTQIFPNRKQEPSVLPQAPLMAALPKFEKIFPTAPEKAIKQAVYKAPAMALRTPTAEETLNMLATTPLERLAAASGGIMAPAALDAGTPMLRSRGNTMVLKSGISQQTTNVDLTMNKAEVVYLARPASRVSISNPEIASAVVISPTQIQLVGKAVGVANLLVWGDAYSNDHTVVDISVHRDVSVLANQIKYVDPGIQIVPMAAEDTVILSGQAETRESAQLAIEMAKAFFAKGAAGAAANSNGPNSQAPGSAIPGSSTNVINLIKVKGEPSTKVELVRQRLHEVDPNIRLDVVPGPEGNEKVILTGRVANASIASKALNLASVFYGQPGMKLVTAQGGSDFTRMTTNSDGGTTTTSGGSNGAASGGVNMLQGSVMTDATGNVISMLEIAQKPQIKCSIKFLELNRSALDALGHTMTGASGNSMLASWSGAQSPAPGRAIAGLSSENVSGSGWTSNASSTNGGTLNPVTRAWGSNFNQVFQNGITQVLSISDKFSVAVQALQEKRKVRTLAEPTLTMLSGEQGSFLAGGEIPIAFVGGQGQVSIQYHEFGIRLNLLPSVTDDGKIQMQVAPEVSALDQTNGVSTNSINVPAFTTRRMQTTLLVEPGQSFVLAGLFSQQDTDSVSRLPGVGSLPIIGSFFRNTWKNKNNSEMVVIVKPEVIYSNTAPAANAQAPQPTGENKTELSRN